MRNTASRFTNGLPMPAIMLSMLKAIGSFAIDRKMKKGGLRAALFILLFVVYGTSMLIVLPEKLKFGRFLPFMNFAAVCESAVMIIGKAIEGSAGT